MNNQLPSLGARGFAWSNASSFYTTLIGIASMFAMLIMLLPLVHFFPMLRYFDCLPIIPPLIIFVIVILNGLFSFYTVILEPEQIKLQYSGKTFKVIPVSSLQLFCAVGDFNEDRLCLSCFSVEEMAQMQENRLLKNPLTKYEVPFRKRKADWQDSFAKDFLNWQRSKPFSAFRKHNTVMLEISPALQYQINRLYPHLPYKNYTNVSSGYASVYSNINGNRAVCFPLQLRNYNVDLKPDGIYLFNKKEAYLHMPASKIKTAIRIDIFKEYERYLPHHIPLMVISTLTEEELAAQAHIRLFKTSMSVEDNQELMAMIAATNIALHWTNKQTEFCVVNYTEKNVKAILDLYPDVHHNTIAQCWLNNTEHAQ